MSNFVEESQPLRLLAEAFILHVWQTIRVTGLWAEDFERIGALAILVASNTVGWVGSGARSGPG